MLQESRSGSYSNIEYLKYTRIKLSPHSILRSMFQVPNAFSEKTNWSNQAWKVCQHRFSAWLYLSDHICNGSKLIFQSRTVSKVFLRSWAWVKAMRRVMESYQACEWFGQVVWQLNSDIRSGTDFDPLLDTISTYRDISVLRSVLHANGTSSIDNQDSRKVYKSV